MNSVESVSNVFNGFPKTYAVSGCGNNFKIRCLANNECVNQYSGDIIFVGSRI